MVPTNFGALGKGAGGGEPTNFGGFGKGAGGGLHIPVSRDGSPDAEEGRRRTRVKRGTSPQAQEAPQSGPPDGVTPEVMRWMREEITYGICQPPPIGHGEKVQLFQIFLVVPIP